MELRFFNQIKYYQLSWVNRASLNYQGSRNRSLESLTHYKQMWLILRCSKAHYKQKRETTIKNGFQFTYNLIHMM